MNRSDETNPAKPKTNAEIRIWYLDRVASIAEMNEQWIADGISPRARAEAAWRIRREARLEARSMMADPREVELLRARDTSQYGNPEGSTFEFLVQRLRNAGLEGDAVYEAIVEGSYRTDPSIGGD
jgi:hypothetical protein